MPHFCGRTHSNRLRSESYSIAEAAPFRLGEPTHAEIAELAYSYWEKRGRTGGSPWEDWFRAEQELIERQKRPAR